MKTLHRRRRNIYRNTGTNLMRKASSLFQKKKRINDGISQMVGDLMVLRGIHLINEVSGVFWFRDNMHDRSNRCEGFR